MYLTREEERMLSGELGELYSKALRVLVKLGEALGAEKLVKVSWAHVSGISYTTIGDAGLELMEEFSNVRTLTKSTCNPAGIDVDKWMILGVREDYYMKQMRILRSLTKMGVETTLTCTPYLLYTPKTGEHIAWGESSAVLFANSVYSARSNREGGPSSLFSAITGRTPYYGLHIDDNRTPTAKVVVDCRVDDPSDIGVLGYLIGEVLGSGVPLIENLPLVSVDALKLFCAGMGCSSSIGLTLIKGVTPEARRIADVESYDEKIVVTNEDIKEVYERLSDCILDNEEFSIFLGCPHLSMSEAWNLINRALSYKPLHKVYLAVEPETYKSLKERNLVEKLLERNVVLLNGTCLVVSPLKDMNTTSLVTDSAKAAHYIRSLHKIPVTLAKRSDCIKLAFKGG